MSARPGTAQLRLIPMSTEHTRSLRSNRVRLIHDMLPKEILDYLIADDIFTVDDSDKVSTEQNNSDKTRCLLDTLQRKPDAGYRCLIKALNETGQRYIAEYLEASPGKVPIRSATMHCEKPESDQVSWKERCESAKNKLKILEEENLQLKNKVESWKERCESAENKLKILEEENLQHKNKLEWRETAKSEDQEAKPRSSLLQISLGMGIFGGRVIILLHRNTILPASASQTMYGGVDDGVLPVDVFAGERPLSSSKETIKMRRKTFQAFRNLKLREKKLDD